MSASCSWGALDDEGFFVIEGSGVALTLGVELPDVRSPVVCMQINLPAGSCGCGQTHALTSSPKQQQQQQQQQQHQATGFTGRLFFFVLTSLVLVCGRTLMLHTLREQRGDAASAGYGRTGGMSSSHCKCSWPRMNTTPPHGDRAGPGAGCGKREVQHGQVTEHPTPQLAGIEYFSLDVEDVPATGSRPDRLAGVRPQERVQQHFVDQFVAVPPDAGT